MEVVLKECLRMINIMDMELKSMSLVLSMKEIGSTTSAMDMEYIQIRKEHHTLEIGLMTVNKVTDLKNGQLVHNMREITNKV